MGRQEKETQPAQDTGLNDLRYYLRAWSRWVRAWRAPLGLPSCVSMVGQMLPSVSGWSHDEDIDDSINAHVLREIDREIERLPALERAAVKLFYLNEVLPAVFRSNRMTMVQMRELCIRAEREMLPKLIVRGVVLRI